MSCIESILGSLILSVVCEFSQVICQADNGHYVEGEPAAPSPPPPPPPIEIGRQTLSAAYLRENLRPGPDFGESPVEGPERDQIGTRAGATGDAIGPVEVYFIRPTQGRAQLVNACLCAEGNDPFLLVRTETEPDKYMRYDVSLANLHL